ncbi:unnamed protein product [Adineta ricciae]|uniref:Uncharacterized protein n=1 Tax=Adineta ricciae TaxID=249248 RepID=A0A815T1V6_ADIRI|nr:unnamed protein product [Adineta ricciae]CAF1498499.1 unnamed protein product [Adineta ricciae]
MSSDIHFSISVSRTTSGSSSNDDEQNHPTNLFCCSSTSHVEQLSLQPDTQPNSNIDRNYLYGDQILNSFARRSIHMNFMIHDCVTYAYITTLASILDEWIRENYREKLWKTYLKLGQQWDYWAPEVLRSISRSSNADARVKFIEDKLNTLRLHVRSLIHDYIECSWTFKQHRRRNCDTETVTRLLELSRLNISGMTFPMENFNDSTLKLEKYVRDYIMRHNRHFRQFIDNKIQRTKFHASHHLSIKHFMENQ